MGIFSAISREIHYLKNALRVLGALKSVDSDSNNLVCDDIEATVDRYPKNVAFIEDDRTLTYAEFEAYANQVAHWALSQSCRPDDTVEMLSASEALLLSCFLRSPKRILSRDQLLDRVWGRDIYVDSRTVDVHVGRLRKALRGATGTDDPIRTVRGAGYALG